METQLFAYPDSAAADAAMDQRAGEHEELRRFPYVPGRPGPVLVETRRVER